MGVSGMDCKDIMELINMYIDGMLDETDAHLLEEHFKKCPTCREQFEETKALVTLVKDLDEEELPSGFSERLHIRLENEIGKTRQSGPLHWMKWVGMAAVIAVLLLSVRMLNILDLKGQKDAEQPESSQAESEEWRGESTADTQEMSDEADTDDARDMVTASEESAYKGAESDNGSHAPMEQENSAQKTVDYIKSDIVELKVKDVCITPETLMAKVLKHDIDVLDISETDITLQVTTIDQRKVLYEELKSLGTVKDIGQDYKADIVSIIIIQEE